MLGVRLWRTSMSGTKAMPLCAESARPIRFFRYILTGVRLLQTGRHISPRRECRHAWAVWPDMPRNSYPRLGHIQMAWHSHGTMAGQETATVASNRRKMVGQRALSCRNMGSVRAVPN